MCRRFAQTYTNMPGTWSGITAGDIAYLMKGPGDRSTVEGWMQDKLYDAAWIEVTQNGRYTTPEGIVHAIRLAADGDLILVRQD